MKSQPRQGEEQGQYGPKILKVCVMFHVHDELDFEQNSEGFGKEDVESECARATSQAFF